MIRESIRVTLFLHWYLQLQQQSEESMALGKCSFAGVHRFWHLAPATRSPQYNSQCESIILMNVVHLHSCISATHHFQATPQRMYWVFLGSTIFCKSILLRMRPYHIAEDNTGYSTFSLFLIMRSGRVRHSSFALLGQLEFEQLWLFAAWLIRPCRWLLEDRMQTIPHYFSGGASPQRPFFYRICSGACGCIEWRIFATVLQGAK